MRAVRVVAGVVCFGVMMVIAFGTAAMSIGGIYGQSRDDGVIGVEGTPALGATIVLTGDGFGPDAAVRVELAESRPADAVVEIVAIADAEGNVRASIEVTSPITAGTWVAAMHGQTADGATRVLWLDDLVVSEVLHLCKGEVATIVGTDGDDALVGTSGRDVIVGLAGDDDIRGLDGDDLICAGPGNDNVRGGSGADQIHGQGGADRLRGQSGRDTLTGGSGSDRLWGGGAADRLRGNGSSDVVKGGSGSDNIRGGGGGDRLVGGSGTDVIKGNKGADTIDGGRGLDRCSGGSGTDSLANCE